jgi:hypothetical protein
MLTSRQPIWIGWGKELIKFYNDPYKSIAGGKHPWALGKPRIGRMEGYLEGDRPLAQTGDGKRRRDLCGVAAADHGTERVPRRNHIIPFLIRPYRGIPGRTAGMICANTDDTERIISERQLKTLTQLGANLTDAPIRPGDNRRNDRHFVGKSA